ncbi:DUF3311 domain-containing protein [Rubrobacter naiadicus]|uniref:DUF3311 domain-containing protein n=1 Tax=Rubrobacter naiadicus TaxID=1392641 RepID=UPI0023608166|nr:DUF3311 domain-containing protein [Rubrobacter naiadicus]
MRCIHESFAEKGVDLVRNGRPRSENRDKRWWNLLLLLPFLGLLFPQLYASDAPRLFGWPFFYWYQFIWLFITAAIVTTVYRATR